MVEKTPQNIYSTFSEVCAKIVINMVEHSANYFPKCPKISEETDKIGQMCVKINNQLSYFAKLINMKNVRKLSSLAKKIVKKMNKLVINTAYIDSDTSIF